MDNFNICELHKIKIIDIITNSKFRFSLVDEYKIDFDCSENLFAEGHEVNDFLSLDHNMIHNIGIGSIKYIDKNLSSVQIENNYLKDQIVLLKEKLNVLSNHLGLGEIV